MAFDPLSLWVSNLRTLSPCIHSSSLRLTGVFKMTALRFKWEKQETMSLGRGSQLKFIFVQDNATFLTFKSCCKTYLFTARWVLSSSPRPYYLKCLSFCHPLFCEQFKTESEEFISAKLLFLHIGKQDNNHYFQAGPSFSIFVAKSLIIPGVRNLFILPYDATVVSNIA